MLVQFLKLLFQDFDNKTLKLKAKQSKMKTQVRPGQHRKQELESSEATKQAPSSSKGWI